MMQPNPEVVIELWNRVAEDIGTLEQTLMKFAALLLAAARKEDR